MNINLAHLRTQATNGGWIDFVVFDAKSTNGDHSALLAQLTNSARQSGLKVDQSALAFQSSGRLQFVGDKNLVSYLAKSWRPHWTHTINV